MDEGIVVPVVIFGGLFLFLILRSYFRYKLHRTAVEKGQPLPETPRSRGDIRKPALVLIALGLGFMVAMQTTLSYVPDHDAPAPIAVSIWGIVPLLMGAGQWLYWRITEKERQQEAPSTA
ncbi:MAG: hypothetical protein FJY95_03045 [Candidatus Handelsmanbacteria bacterium]|nr:hypothetical protein [Candidatus Handelsmanbacteria bacterium]